MRKKVPVLTDPSQVNFFVKKLNNEASLDVIDELTDNQSWLVESGLIDELAGGRLAHEATI